MTRMDQTDPEGGQIYNRYYICCISNDERTGEAMYRLKVSLDDEDGEWVLERNIRLLERS